MINILFIFFPLVLAEVKSKQWDCVIAAERVGADRDTQ
jgi:hypothetical protein